MELLELYLSPITKACFKVIATSSLGIKGDTESNVPFRKGRVDRRITVLKTLEAISFRCEDFLVDGEQDWMVEAGLLTQDRRAFHPKRLVTIGQILYNTLFPSGKPIRSVLEKSLAKADDKNTQLHIQLQFAPDDLQLVRLPDYPWELMHDGQDFLAHHQVTFSRYIAYDTVPPNKSGVDQVKVLLVSSKAFDENNKLDPLPEQEQQAIREALKVAEQEKTICLDQLENATFDELRAYLTQHRGNKAPHVFHFDGHGWFGQRCNNDRCRRIHQDAKADNCKICDGSLSEVQGYLLFEDKAGGANYVSAKELGVLLQHASFGDDVNQQRGVALVVLSACQSALSLRGNSIFNGIAQNLISHRIPAVVAMQYKIEVSSASTFAEQFYLCLGKQDSLALAVSKARGAMGVEGNQWYRPVLYLRWKDNEGGQLFAASRGPVTPNIEQLELVQNLRNQLASASHTQPLGEINNEIEKLTLQTRSLKLAKSWLEDENYRWDLASNLTTTVLQGRSLGVYSKPQAKEKAEYEFKTNLFTCIYWLFNSFQTGYGKDIDDFKEYLIEHPLELYINALIILKAKVEEDFHDHPDVIGLMYSHIDELIKKIRL